MRAQLLWLAIICLALSGCGEGMYSATSNKDGVIVVNRFTGTVQRVEGDTLIELHAGLPKANIAHKPTFARMTIPKQPFFIQGFAKYRDGMLLKLSVLPNDTIKSPDQWSAWRAHIASIRPSSSLHLEFMDSDGFTVKTYDASLAELRQLVDSKGDFTELSEQFTVPVSKDTYDDIVGWSIGWTGFYQDFKLASD